MQAGAASFSFIKKESKVSIPFFQRRYVWDEKNWDALLEDLLDTKRKTFLGSLILKQLNKTGSVKEAVVIDGQQRLTTLSILLKAAFDVLPEDIQQNCLGDLNNCLFYKEMATSSQWHVKIAHSHLDRSDYQRVIEHQNPSELLSLEGGSQILKCYQHLHKRLSDTSTVLLDAIVNLFNRMVDQDNQILVLIDLAADENEQAIFDTINSAGVRLTSADIIKNALFQKAIALCGESETLTLYKDTWEKAFLEEEDEASYWSAKHTLGRLQRDNIEILLHSILVIKEIFDPENNTISDLTSLYKTHIAGLSKEALLQFIEEIVRYAKIYREQLDLGDNPLYRFDDVKKRILHLLDASDTSTFTPYLLSLFEKHDGNDVLPEKLRDLERMVVRRFITKAETKSYNKLCVDLIKDDSRASKEAQEITDDEVKQGLLKIGNKEARPLLFWVELARRANDAKQEIKSLHYGYTLEHVMPQKWEEHWGYDLVPFVDNLGAPLENTQSNAINRNKAIYCIGNMTLLNSSLNTSIRNYDLDIKMKGQEGKRGKRGKGIKDYADLSITKDDIVNPYETDPIWNEHKIAARSEKLIGEILAIW